MEFRNEEVAYTKIEAIGLNGQKVIVTERDGILRLTIPKPVELTLDDLDALAAACRRQFS